MGQLEKIWSDAAAEVHQIVVGPMDNNVYILRCRRTGDAMLIDAANEHEALLEICQRLGVRQVVETHGHWDHIQAVPAVRDAGISVAVTSADAGMLPELRPHLGGRRDAAGRRPAHQDPRHAGPHARVHLLRRRGHATCCSPATPSSRAARATPRSRAATSPRSSTRSSGASSPRSTPTPWCCPATGTSTTVGDEAPHLQEWVDRGW